MEQLKLFRLRSNPTMTLAGKTSRIVDNDIVRDVEKSKPVEALIEVDKNHFGNSELRFFSAANLNNRERKPSLLKCEMRKKLKPRDRVRVAASHRLCARDTAKHRDANVRRFCVARVTCTQPENGTDGMCFVSYRHIVTTCGGPRGKACPCSFHIYLSRLIFFLRVFFFFMFIGGSLLLCCCRFISTSPIPPSFVIIIIVLAAPVYGAHEVRTHRVSYSVY